MRDIYLILVMSGIVTSLMWLPLIISLVIAQTASIDKEFIKDFCISENNLLDDILYSDGNQLSYDSSGCPVSTKIIHKWNELTTVQQNLIITRLSTQGYIEGQEINSMTGEVVNR